MLPNFMYHTADNKNGKKYKLRSTNFLLKPEMKKINEWYKMCQNRSNLVFISYVAEFKAKI